MKKLITLLLVLTGMVCTAMADTGVFYLKKLNDWNDSNKPNIHVWDTSGNITTYPGPKIPTEVNLYGVSFYKYEFTYSGNYNVILNWDSDIYKSTDVTGLTGTVYYNWSGTTGDAPTTYDTSISSVQLIGGSLPTQTLTLNDGNYTGSIDLSSTMLDKSFKVVVTLGSGDTGWLGWNANTLTKTDTESLLSAESGDWSYFVINNKSYKTYNISVSFTNPTTWALTFAGNTARAHTTYNFTVSNDAGWSTVRAYTFSPDGDNQTGAWDSADAMTDNGNGTWSLSKTLYEPYPQKVIFKDDASNQTKNLYLTNGYTDYTNKPYASTKYYVVGDIAAFANFDQTKDLAEMEAAKDGVNDIHALTVEDVALSSGTVLYKIVAKDYAKESDPAWYPNDDKEISITENGKYDIYVRFNDYWGDKGLETVSSNNTTLKSIPATIGTTGYATFSSATHDLDFTGITNLTAYRAESAAAGKVTMTEVTGKVPANTGLFLSGTSDYIPVTTGASSIGTNLLKPTTGSDIHDTSDSKVQYVFAKQNEEVGFYKVGSSLSPAAGKAYLETTGSVASARLAILFDDDSNTTAIKAVKKDEKTNGEYYNLAGQRVAQPSKGLYIVNGKKFIVK